MHAHVSTKTDIGVGCLCLGQGRSLTLELLHSAVITDRQSPGIQGWPCAFPTLGLPGYATTSGFLLSA